MLVTRLLQDRCSGFFAQGFTSALGHLKSDVDSKYRLTTISSASLEKGVLLLLFLDDVRNCIFNFQRQALLSIGELG